jgi:DNA-directed RNA polymerase subunit RPC12/RpoP
MVEEKRRFSITNLFRRTTPKPGDRTVYNPGIQEKDLSYMITSPVIYHVANQSIVLRTCITQLKNEIFRRGYHWEEKFTRKCRSCGKEHQRPTDECVECGSTDLMKPDPKQLKYIEKFLDGSVNKAQQLFIEVLKEMEDDLNIMDDAYLVMVKEYFLDNNGVIRMHRIKEIFRGDPVSMHIYADEMGERGNKGFTCIKHRDFITEDPGARCETCGGGVSLYPVYYVNRVNGMEQYYLKNEVLHFSKYSPGRLYGLSPVITLFNAITTLIAMDNYVNSSYTKARMPRGLLAVQTRNMESMKSFWRGVKEKMEQDPHFIPVMGIEGEGGQGSVEWIKFMDSLKEMDYISVKDDLRDRISAFYGVSKIFMADNSSSGGLNNEGMQILVTNRAVEMAQTIWNNYVFPYITNEFGITDWALKLPPSEEEDEIAKLRKREIEVNVAASIKNLGFEVDMDDEGRFIFSKPEPKPEQQGPAEGEDKAIETDPYAGTDIDASQLGQLQEQALAGGSKPQENPPATRNKPSMETGPDKRFTGLPREAGNENVDSRTERRVG